MTINLQRLLSKRLKRTLTKPKLSESLPDATTMINLAHYIQCHPSFRYLRVRHKKTVIVVFIVFLVFFLGKDAVHSGELSFCNSMADFITGDDVSFSSQGSVAVTFPSREVMTVTKYCSSNRSSGTSNQNWHGPENQWTPTIYPSQRFT